MIIRDLVRLIGHPIVGIWFLAAISYFAAAALTIHLTSNGRDIATIWPANAILVALLLAQERPRWGAVLSAGFVAGVAANLITRGASAGAILYGLANLIEVGLAVSLLRRSGEREGILHTTGAVLRFILVAGLVAPAVSAVPGSLTAFALYGEPLPKAFATWVASDGLGLLVFTPFLSTVVRGDFVDGFARKTWRERGLSAALLVLVGLVAYGVFLLATRPLLFAIFPPLMLVTFRVGRLGVEAAVMLVAVIGGIATMQGRGPMILIAADAATQAQAFQAFLAVTLVTCLPVAAEVTARARLTAALAAHGQEMTASAITDALTGTLNRRGFEAEARRWLRAEAPGSLSLIAVDFDHFKQINDRWGHQAGDQALRHFAALVSSHVRAGDRVGRLGGDEFMILLPHSDLDLARGVGERVRAAVENAPLALGGQPVASLSLSMGIAAARSGESYEDLARRADRALYEAKEAGRNTIRWAG
ncbi:hypothetical protein ASF18_02365 [Methylobacterium sp. Leaf89]|nr:hypothetical protein ASF18_02365 [Methylobacterium sp. Leaf89]